MTDFRSNDEFLTALRRLIYKWCDERRLDALCRLLPGYFAFNGMTDGWGELVVALKSVRGLGAKSFNQTDWEALNDLVRAGERALYSRQNSN